MTFCFWEANVYLFSCFKLDNNNNMKQQAKNKAIKTGNGEKRIGRLCPNAIKSTYQHLSAKLSN